MTGVQTCALPIWDKEKRSVAEVEKHLNVVSVAVVVTEERRRERGREVRGE